MSIFDIIGVAQRIPYELIQKLEGDMPKVQQLIALVKQAQPHVDAVIPIFKEGETIWNSISPDVQALIKTIGTPT
jgi:hypothetical protein